MLALTTGQAKAQVSLNINIGNWAPPAEYSAVDYYYLPDVESYYYAPRRQFVYLDGGQWVFRNTLPPRYRDYRLDRGYMVAVNRPRAYRYFSTDRAAYGRYRGLGRNTIIRGNSFRTVKRVNVYRDHGPGRGPAHFKGSGGRGPGGPGRGPGGPGRGPGGHGHGPGGPGHGGGHGHGRH